MTGWSDWICNFTPELARLLASWRLSGFASVYGRPPTNQDFIVPDPRTMGARTESQVTKAHRRNAELLGIYVPSRGTHGLRRFFISHARGGGARKDVLERITHNATGDIVDAYTSFEWEPLCEAMLCLKVDLQRGELVALPRRATGTDGERIAEDHSELVSLSLIHI